MGSLEREDGLENIKIRGKFELFDGLLKATGRLKHKNQESTFTYQYPLLDNVAKDHASDFQILQESIVDPNAELDTSSIFVNTDNGGKNATIAILALIIVGLIYFIFRLKLPDTNKR